MMEFKDLPVEIQERMLDEQVRQGNTRNAEVFEKNIGADGTTGGFDWADSVEGKIFWREVLDGGNIAAFYEKYPKKTALNIIPLHVKILDSKGLLEEIAEKLHTKWHDEGQPTQRVEIDWFEYGGLWWSANAEMEADYKVTHYRDTPPESYCRGMSVILGAIECTDEAGSLVLVDYFDDERTRINEDDYVRKSIIDMEMEGN